MDTALAILGILLSSIALAWQAYERWAEHATRLGVAISEAGDGYANYAYLTIVNKSRRPVTIRTAGFELPFSPRPNGEEGKSMVFQLSGGETSGSTALNRTIPPGDSWTRPIEKDVIVSYLGDPPVVTAYACAADGKDFVSKPTELWGERWRQQVAEIKEAKSRLYGGLG